MNRMRHDGKADGLHEGQPTPGLEKISPSQGIGPQARKRIGTHLRAYYATILEQPVPDRFTDLIAQFQETVPDPGHEHDVRNAV